MWRIGVVTGGHRRGLKLDILTGADDADAAREHALQLITASLDELGLAGLAPLIEVEAVTGRRPLVGGPHLVRAAPALDHRTTRLPDGRVVRAACSGPLGDWYAHTDNDPSRVMAGRSLLDVISELFELPWGKKESWFYEAVEELAGHPTSHGVRYPCPCCGQLTLEEPPPDTFAICAVCRWEDDRVQFRDPDRRGGANRVSLKEARENYRHYGKSDDRRATPGMG